MSEIAPQQRWPWTSWVQITDCFLRAADSTHPAGSTGGAWEVVQTVEQMPKHTHVECAQTGDGNNNSIINTGYSGNFGGAYMTFNWNGDGHEQITTENTGNSQPMPIVNKYTAFYMWKRIS